jgi:hypothetical protein
MICRNSNETSNVLGAFLHMSLYLQTSTRHVPEGSIVPVCGLRLREQVLRSEGQTGHQCIPTAYRLRLCVFS